MPTEYAEQASSGRRYEFDWLRGLGAVLVVVAHCAVVFAPWMPEVAGLPRFPRTEWLGEIPWLLNPFLMPLFMLLAGASLHHTLVRRRRDQLVHERLTRLLPPLAVGVLILAPVSVYLGRVSAGAFHGSLIQFYPSFFDAPQPAGNFTPLHLWFLAYLLLYTLAALPLLRLLNRVAGRLADLCRQPGGLYLLALPLLAIQVGLASPWPQPDWPALVNDWARFVFFFVVFLYGYLLAADARFDEALAQQWRLAGLLVVITSAALFMLALNKHFNPRTDLPLSGYSWRYVALQALLTVCTWSWCIFLLGTARRYLNQRHPLGHYAGEASLALYLLHPFVLYPVVFLVAPVNLPPLPAFLLLTAIVLSATLVLCELLRRCPGVGPALGLKQLHKSPPVASRPAGIRVAVPPARPRPAAR